jgi:hypothetical protein
MSNLQYCQGTKCHTYRTKDRIRGCKGDKHYETRKKTYYHDEFCSMRCQDDWFRTFGNRAIDHFGRVREPKRTDCDNAWYKSYDWRSNGRSIHFFVNDLLGERINITEQQYQDDNLTKPNSKE